MKGVSVASLERVGVGMTHRSQSGQRQLAVRVNHRSIKLLVSSRICLPRAASFVPRARRAKGTDVSTSSGTLVQQQEVSTSDTQIFNASPSLVSQLVFSVSVIACSLSVAIAALMFRLLPAIKSLREAATEIALLARVLREETPDTLAALRLSGVEISDCVEEIGELSNDLTRGIRTSARTIAATSGAVKEGAHYVKDNVYPVVKERVVPVATSTMKTVLEKRADMNSYDKPVIAMAASRTARVIKGIRTLMLTRDIYDSVGVGSLAPVPAQPAKPARAQVVNKEEEGEPEQEWN